MTAFSRQYFPTDLSSATPSTTPPCPTCRWPSPRIPVNNGLGEYLSHMGLTQLRIAETEKYAHVTFFFNGGVGERYFPARTGCWCPPPRWPPTTSSRR
ncbi:MAG: hypothetical protein ACLR5H_12155 [Oscillospiraceae bacterium]